MEKRPLGNSLLHISPVGIGTAPIGSSLAWKIFWGPQDEQAAIRAIHVAIDLGVNWIDTAPFYGWGRAEEIVGKAIRGRRDQVYLFTKCGTLNDGRGGWLESLKPESIRREIEASLRRLQTDRIDLYQFHDPDPETPIEDSWAKLQELIEAGKVRCGGLSNHPLPLIRRAMAVGPLTAVQHQYSLLERGLEGDVLPFAASNRVGVLAWGTLAHGFLARPFAAARLHPDDFRHSHPYTEPARLARIRQLQQTLSELARQHNRSSADLAIAWTLRHPALSGAIVGIRNEQEARALARAGDWVLDDQMISAVDSALENAGL